MYIQTQKALRTPNRHDHKRTSPCHILLKMPRLQRGENFQVAYKGKHVRVTQISNKKL